MRISILVMLACLCGGTVQSETNRSSKSTLYVAKTGQLEIDRTVLKTEPQYRGASYTDKHFSQTFGKDGGSVPVGRSKIYYFTFTSHSAMVAQNIHWIGLTGGGSDVQVINNQCQGAVLSHGSQCTFSLEYTPATIGFTSVNVRLEWDATFDNGWVPDTGDFNIEFRASSFHQPIERYACESGSIIRIDSRSVGERVPVAGTNIYLTYSSEFSSQFLGSKTSDLSSVSQRYSFFNGAWGLSIHHLYGVNQHRLFMGTGTVLGRSYLTSSDGKLLVVSENRDEVYVFSPQGKHLETRTFLTGALLYRFLYDSSDNLVQIYDAYDNLTQIVRSSGGTITSIVSPFGLVTTLHSDSEGRVIAIANPLGETHSFSYHVGTTLLHTFSKPGGQVSTFTYDGSGKLISDTSSGGRSWTLTEALSGELTKSSQMGRQTQYGMTWDALANYTRIETSPEGMTTSVVQDYYNNQGFSNWFGSSWTTTDQDVRYGWNSKRVSGYSTSEAGQTRQTTISQSVSYPIGTSPGLFNFSTLTETSQTSGRTLSRAFHRGTNTMNVVSSSGQSTTVEYNQFEQPTSIRIGNDNPLTFVYDLRGRLSSKQRGVGNFESYSYDSQTGHLWQVSNGRGETITFGRDPLGRVTSMMSPDGRSTYYSYDANGNLVSVTPPDRTAHTFLFGGNELLSAYTPPIAANIGNRSTTYSYNTDGQVTLITAPNGQAQTFDYNLTTGLLNSISTSWGSFNYTYHSGSPALASAVSYNGIRTDLSYRGSKIASDVMIHAGTGGVYGRVDFGFDSSHRIISRTVQGAPSQPADTATIVLNDDNKPIQYGDVSLQYEYPSGRLSMTGILGLTDQRTYDSNGLLVGYSASYGGTNLYAYTLTRDVMDRIVGKVEVVQGVSKTYSYQYDSAGRLISVVEDGQPTMSFGYDSNGNRTTIVRNGTSHALTYDGQDRLIGFDGNSYSYKASGELYRIQNGAGQITNYIFDPMSRLSRVEFPNGTISRNYYDGLGRLGGHLFAANYTRMLLYEDRNRVAATAYPNGQIQKIYYYATGGHAPDVMKTSTAQYRILQDHLGSPRLVVRLSDGVVVQRIDYDVLGKVVNDTAPMLQPFAFAGGLYDPETKFVHFGARDYDPEVGRWLSKDPILFAGGDTNLYGYVVNDPINLIDPTGLYWFRQDWQTPGEVGRVGSIVPPAPAGQISDFIERHVPAGYTFGQNHDAFVDWATSRGVPDWLANIPSMIPLYGYSVGQEALRSAGIINQPTPSNGQMCK